MGNCTTNYNVTIITGMQCTHICGRLSRQPMRVNIRTNSGFCVKLHLRDGRTKRHFFVRPSLRWSLTQKNERTDGQKDAHGLSAPTTSTTIAAVTPCRRCCDSSTVSRHKRTDERRDRRREYNLVHFSLKMLHLMVIILMIFLIIN